jgi:hypothetical protein
LAVAVGEDERGLLRGVERGECALKVDDSHVAGVGVGLAAFSPCGALEARGAAKLEGGTFDGGLAYNELSEC